MNPLAMAALMLGGLVYLRKRQQPEKRILRNVDGFLDDTGFHPIRGSTGYDPELAGDGTRKAPADLKAFIKDIDHEIASTRIRMRKAGSSKRDINQAVGELKEVRLNGIVASLSSRMQDKYEKAQDKIDQLETFKFSAESAWSDPAWEYRDLATLYRRVGTGDVTHEGFRRAVKQKYGMTLDEIAESIHPGDPHSEDKLIRDVQRIKQTRREGTNKALNTEMKDLKTFVDKIETGRVFRLKPPKIKLLRTRKSKGEITSLSAARRFGRQVKDSKTAS